MKHGEGLIEKKNGKIIRVRYLYNKLVKKKNIFQKIFCFCGKMKKSSQNGKNGDAQTDGSDFSDSS